VVSGGIDIGRQWSSLPKQARARPKGLPDGWVARWLDGLDGHFDSLDRMETKRSKCCDGRVLSTHALPISVDPVLHFQMTQAAGGIVVHC
jgi:hypothetical protein